MIYVVNVANKIIKILNMRIDIYPLVCLCGHLPPLALILQLNYFPPVTSVGVNMPRGWRKNGKCVCACVRKISKEGSMKNGACKRPFLTLLVTLIGRG